MKNLTLSNDELVTIHRSLSLIQKNILPYNDHSVDHLFLKVSRIIKDHSTEIISQLDDESFVLKYKIKHCKVNDALYALDSYEYLFNHYEAQLEYLNAWLNEIKNTAPCQK